MNLAKWLGLCGVCAFLMFFGARSCATMRDPLAFVGVQVPDSALISHRSFPSLTGDEDLMLFQLSPAQASALLAQFNTKHASSLGGLTIPTSPGAPDKGLAPVNKFFSSVPASAQNGSFRVDNGEESAHPWPIFCWYSFDRETGRMWFYAWSVYN